MKTASHEVAKPRLELGTLNDERVKTPLNTDTELSGLRTLNDVYSIISDDRNSGKGWYTKVVAFNSGDVECIALKLDSDQSIRKGGGAKRSNTQKSEMDEIVLQKSQARAKKNVRYKSLMLNADRMLTLTYRENKTDLDLARADLAKFSRAMKDTFGKQWQYIAVPEFQKRGAVHFHLAISGFYPVKTVRSIWRSVVGDGNIDITSPKIAIGKNSWNPRRIANYLAKYITKTDSVSFNKRRYSSSNIPSPPFVTGWLPITIGLCPEIIMCRIIRMLSNREPTDFYETSESYYPLIIVST
ncbi:hypothetical protein [Methylophaga sp.]|uniref:rolling circle replication-associated protein n=1 Tax=Methylophaga sp. TaxID=2024840 RepID=UPI002725A3F2|nr:hypothetical protein [Methylophaga sp.]MDO8827477.1 hypothetical protein [Methylophaga sp.]